MTSLLVAEWLRFRRRYDLWIVLGGVVLLTAFAYISSATSAAQPVVFAPIDPTAPPEIRAMIEAQNAQIALEMARLRDRYVFPLSIVTTLELGSWLFLATAFVAASWIATEFDWRTIRNVLLFEPNRDRVLAARLVALATVASGGIVVLLSLGALLPFAVPVTGSGEPLPVTAVGVAVTAGVTWLWAAAFGALATVAALVTRSPLLAVVLSAGYTVLEQLVANLDVWKRLGLDLVPQFFLVSRLNALRVDVQQAFPLGQPYAPLTAEGPHLDPILGLGVLGLWIAGLVLLARTVFVRADIHE